MIKNIFFDLDGTISDSSKGVFRSFNYALKKMGGKSISFNEVGQFIGPKLNDSFKMLLNLKSDEDAQRAVDFFREDYTVTGYKINELYPGIKNLIFNLKEKDYRLFVATTKRKDVAVNVIKYFNFDKYFDDIYGGGTTVSKDKLLANIITENSLKNKECIMVGDTHFDFEAAKANNLISIGVTWGYGNDDELKLADYIVKSPGEIMQCIQNLQS